MATEDIKVSNRPDWDHFWFLIALMYSTRGTCDRFRTATVIVKDKKLVGAGYNGSPPGADHCDDVGHLMISGHCERCVHGEANAIINTERQFLKGASVYIIGSPCLRCTNELIAAGVSEIHCMGRYANALGQEHIRDLCVGANVKIRFHRDFEPQDLIDEATERLKDLGGALYNEDDHEESTVA